MFCDSVLPMNHAPRVLPILLPLKFVTNSGTVTPNALEIESPACVNAMADHIPALTSLAPTTATGEGG